MGWVCSGARPSSAAAQAGWVWASGQRSSAEPICTALAPERTQPTRAFSGRLGRAVANDYVRAAADAGAPRPAPYPVQRGLTANLRQAAAAESDPARMQMWAGQAAGLARPEPAADLVQRIWAEAQGLLA